MLLVSAIKGGNLVLIGELLDRVVPSQDLAIAAATAGNIVVMRSLLTRNPTCLFSPLVMDRAVESGCLDLVRLVEQKQPTAMVPMEKLLDSVKNNHIPLVRHYSHLLTGTASLTRAVKTAYLHNRLDLLKHLCSLYSFKGNGTLQLFPTESTPVDIDRQVDDWMFGAHPNYAPNWYRIKVAAARGDFETMSQMIDDGGDVNTTHGTHMAGLAVQRNLMDVLIVLASKYPSSRPSPFSIGIAASNGYTEIIQFTLDTYYSKELTPTYVRLDFACISGHLETVKVLLSHMAFLPPHLDGSLVKYALVSGNKELIHYLIEKLKWRPTNDKIFKAIKRSCLRGQMSTVRLLIDHLAIKDIPRPDRISKILITDGHLDILEYLVQEVGMRITSHDFYHSLNLGLVTISNWLLNQLGGVSAIEVPDYTLFSVDLKDLSHRFKSAQKRLHPDLFHQRSDKEQSLSKDQSTALNTSYNILKSPFLRAEYMLQCKGFDLTDVNDVDPEVLMEVLEIREAIEDANDDEEAVKTIAHENRNKMNLSEEKLANLFSKNDYNAALAEAVYLRYLVRIQEEVHKRLGVHI
eukprot:gene18247-21832_t